MTQPLRIPDELTKPFEQAEIALPALEHVPSVCSMLFRGDTANSSLTVYP